MTASRLNWVKIQLPQAGQYAWVKRKNYVFPALAKGVGIAQSSVAAGLVVCVHLGNRQHRLRPTGVALPFKPPPL